MNRVPTLALFAASCCLPFLPDTALGSVISVRSNAGAGEDFDVHQDGTLTPSIPETFEVSASSPTLQGASSGARGGIGLNNVDLGAFVMSENRTGAPEFAGSAGAEVEESITFFNISDPFNYDGVILKVRLTGELTITGRGANGYSRDQVARIGLSVRANIGDMARERHNFGVLELYGRPADGVPTELIQTGLFIDELNNRPRTIQTTGSPESRASLTINETLFIALPDLHLLAGPHRIRLSLSVSGRNGGSSAFFNSLSFDAAEPVLLYTEETPGEFQTFTPVETGLVVTTEGGGFVPEPVPEGSDENIALAGGPIMGLAPLDNGTFGIYHINAQGYLTPNNSEFPGELNDGDISSSSVVDTYSGDGFIDDPSLENPDGGANDYDFLGITWNAPQDGVVEINFYQRIFGDGGWWGGLNNAVAPKVQVTRDGGTTWTDVADVQTDYETLVSPTTQNGQVVGPIAFTFPAQDDIDGIRLFGEGGGRAGVDVSGFVSGAEFEVYSNLRPPPPPDFDDNVAEGAQPLMGLAPLDDGSFGVYHINAQGYLTPHNFEFPGELNDGDIGLSSVVDTYSGDGFIDDPNLENPDGGANPYDFLGIQWGQPRQGVNAIRLYQRIFGDGGWFGGLNNAVAPKVQVTRDGGTTWTDVTDVETDYETLVSPTTQNGQVVGPIAFTFPVQNDIDGIRVFGDGGGRAGVDTSGFVAAAEFEVYEVFIPELQFVQDGGARSLIWDAPDFRLETSIDLVNWSTVEGAESPYPVTNDIAEQFYRLAW